MTVMMLIRIDDCRPAKYTDITTKMITRSQIKFIKSLSDKSARTESGFFVVEGTKMVAEAFVSNFVVEEVFVTSAVTPSAFSTRGANGRKVSFTEVSPAEMDRISHFKTASGALALVRMPEYEFDADVPGKELVLALDGVQDPGNVGTIIRIADWFGINNIICSPSTADCYSPKVVQSTMGAVFRVKVHYEDLTLRLSGALRKNVAIYGTMLEGDNIYEAELTSAGIIVMGSEGRGISPSVAGLIDRKLLIPPYRVEECGSESLNVAAATAIVCSEFRRRQK